ncbi:MAG: triosephosphate isomerase [Parachlamydiaceae bacterium]|nr:triosephosphate isomerase [Parachlamydiaceae bacterium]
MEIHENSSPLLLSKWKGYSNIDEVEQFIKTLSEHPGFSDQLCFIALPTPLLRQLSRRSMPEGIVLGAKAMDSVNPDTFTEAIAIPLLKRADAKFVLVGGSECRQILNEANESINLKIRKLFEAEIQPVLCIGETLDDKKHNLGVKVLAEQLREGLKSLTAIEQIKVIILYEATSMLKGPKKYSLADCQMAYDNCRDAMQQALPEEILPHMRVIYTFPDEPIEYDGLIKQNPGVGFYTKASDHFFPLLDTLVKTGHSPVPKPFAHEPRPQSEGFDIESQLDEEQLSITQEATSSLAEKEIEVEKENEIEENEQEDKEAADKGHFETSFDEEKEEEEEGEALEEGVEKNKLSRSVPYKQDLTEPILKEPSMTDSLDFEKNLDDTAEEEGVSEAEFSEPEEKLPVSAESDVIEEKMPVPTESDVIEEELPLQAPQASASTKDTEVRVTEDRNFATRIADLQEDGAALEEMYTSMKEKAKRMNELRANYPIYLDKVSNELNLLDPNLQGHISQGSLEFFKDHPELFEQAQSTFVHVQNLNELIIEAGSIPREIDRLKLKSKNLREKLQNDWDFLNAHRLEMKKLDPDHHFPSQPKPLKVLPPEIDLTLPATPGPSPLLQKRIGVVKKSKKADT